MIPVATPCINVCVIDPRTSLCHGCGRTVDEIAAWATMNEAERMRIMAELPDRMVASHHTAGTAR
jgi:predicted Fe-S protein YdhL (DUF1289 family)